MDNGPVGSRRKLTATACAELVAIDVLKAAGAAVADGVPVDGRLVRARIDELRARGDLDGRLAEAARRAPPVHVLKVCQAWQGGLSKTRRAGRA